MVNFFLDFFIFSKLVQQSTSVYHLVYYNKNNIQNTLTGHNGEEIGVRMSGR